MRGARRVNRWRERGAAAVEFALVLPIFAVLVTGVVEYGFAFARLQIATNAAREGARAGSTQTASSSAATTAATTVATNYLSSQNPKLDPTTVNSTVTATGITVGTPPVNAIKVVVSIPWLTVGYKLFPHPANINATAVMRASYP
jgi:Flp pilus assembly protein TadG